VSHVEEAIDRARRDERARMVATLTSGRGVWRSAA